MAGVNFYYVDDSGDSKRGVLLLTALEVPVSAWSQNLHKWLGWRRFLYRKHGLPTRYELHGHKFVTGRGAPNEDDPDAPINKDKALRHDIYQQSLRQIARCGFRVFTNYRADGDKSAIYDDLMSWIARELVADNAQGVMIVDGLDQGFHRPHHRALPIKSRLIVEDAWMKDSAHCQFVQMADLAVHAAFQGIAQKPTKTFMWDWYRDFVAPAAVPGGPHETGIRGFTP